MRVRSGKLPGDPVADWRLGLETGRVEAQCQEPIRGSERAVRSITRNLPRRECARVSGIRESRAPSLRVKAMEAVKSLERSRQGLPGVEGAERSEGNDGNWRGRPRPGGCGNTIGAGGPITGGEPGRGHSAGTASEAVVVLIEPNGQHNRR